MEKYTEYTTENTDAAYGSYMIYVRYILAVILILLSLSTIFISRHFAIAAASSSSDREKRTNEYLLKDEPMTVFFDVLDVYPALDSDENSGYKIKKGTSIKVVQPFDTNKDVKRIPVIINENGEDKQVYADKEYLCDRTSRSSELFSLKVLKKVDYLFYKNGITDFDFTGIERRPIIITVIICVLLLFGDSFIDGLLSTVIRVEKIVPMIKFVVPTAVYMIFNIILMMASEDKYKEIVESGFALIPKDDSFVAWALYLATAVYLVVKLKFLISLYMNYNLVYATIKFITSFAVMLVFTMCAIVAIGYAIALSLVLGLLTTVASTRTVVVREY